MAVIGPLSMEGSQFPLTMKKPTMLLISIAFGVDHIHRLKLVLVSEGNKKAQAPFPHEKRETANNSERRDEAEAKGMAFFCPMLGSSSERAVARWASRCPNSGRTQDLTTSFCAFFSSSVCLWMQTKRISVNKQSKKQNKKRQNCNSKRE